MEVFTTSFLLLFVLLNPFSLSIYLIDYGQNHDVQTLRQSTYPSESDQPGTIAIPFIIGPGTISPGVLAGSRLEAVPASLAIGLALALSIGTILLFKRLHDYVRERNERLIRRYTEIVGRATALFTGSFAIDMILTGIERWVNLLDHR